MAPILTLSDTAAHNHQRLLGLLRQHAFERREVVLASGRRSDFYIDCRRVVLGAEGHFLCAWLLHHAIRQLCPEAVGVGGMSLGADPLASGVSLMSHLAGDRPLSAFYVRKDRKEHGAGRMVERSVWLADGAPVVIVEDVVTSGGSTLLAAERAEAAGLRPLLALALVDRLEGGRQAVEARMPIATLYTADDFATDPCPSSRRSIAIPGQER